MKECPQTFGREKLQPRCCCIRKWCLLCCMWNLFKIYRWKQSDKHVCCRLKHIWRVLTGVLNLYEGVRQDGGDGSWRDSRRWLRGGDSGGGDGGAVWGTPLCLLPLLPLQTSPGKRKWHGMQRKYTWWRQTEIKKATQLMKKAKTEDKKTTTDKLWWTWNQLNEDETWTKCDVKLRRKGWDEWYKGVFVPRECLCQIIVDELTFIVIRKSLQALVDFM